MRRREFVRLVSIRRVLTMDAIVREAASCCRPSKSAFLGATSNTASRSY